MWNSIANLKENLNRIALDVHGSDEEREIDDECEDPLVSDRRNSNGLAQSKPALRSPAGHAAMDYPFASEIEHYKAEIKRLHGSEAEIKALSVNYAALLKEKEDQISKLNEENGLLKQNLNAANSTLKASRSDGFGASTNNQNALMGDGKNSFNGNNFPNRLHKPTSQLKRSGGTQMNNGFVFKRDGLSNGSIDSVHPDAVESGIEKELTGMLEEKTRTLAAVQETCESQINQVRLQLEKEHNTSVNLQLKLQDELNLRESLQEELSALRQDKENACKEMEKINRELNVKLSEAKQLQMVLHSKENVVADDAVENLKRVIAALEKDNANLKAGKGKQVAALMASRSFSTDEVSPDVSENHIKHQSSMNEKVHSPGSFPGQEELELTVQKMDKGLKEAKQERDKALQELARLKQHLLDKESEESDKMDEDSKIIEELRSNNEQLRARISQMERALKQAIASQEEVKMNNTRELQMSKDTINGLNKKLASCLNTIDAKNVELLNLQTALGQYYAEIEAKEHLEEDFSLAREESARLSELLKNADQQSDVSKKEKEEILLKLSQTEHTLAEAKTRTRKLEDDNAKLRQAVEQSMTRINRMSMDSDYFVDRRIVIKLLVTYFQRNHSKEVLELMVRMLGFSEEDKQRIGFAQQVAGKGVVRGVLGLPSRLVGGILSVSSSEAHSNTASENQSFADLWVDFLLKESEERGRKTVMAEQGGSSNPRPNPNTQAVLPSLQSVHSESEFSTVPLTSSESTKLSPR